MEYEFEEEQKAIEGIIRKIKVISVLLTGRNLVLIRSIPEFTKKLIYNLWKKTEAEKFLPRKSRYYLCKNLYIEGQKVIGYLDKDFVNSVFEGGVITEEALYVLLNTTLPGLFPEYEDEFSHCYDILESLKLNEGTKIFFNTIDKLIEEGKLDINIKELENAKEKINNATTYSYSVFIEEFLDAVLSLLRKYIDKESVFKLTDWVVLVRSDNFIEEIKEYINSFSSGIVQKIEYTDENEIKITFDSSYELYNPNFTNILYKIKDTLDDCIVALEKEFREATSEEELFDNLVYKFGLKYTLLLSLIEMFSIGETISEEDIVSTLTELLKKLPFYVDKVYPTELSLKICDLLKEIQEG